MHFGEWLVKNRIVSAHQILKGLDQQRKQRHFIPLLLVEQGSLPDYQALRYCTQADQNYEDFLEVLLGEGMISQEQCALIRAAWVRSGPPLGKLLVKLGFLSEDALLEALEEFEAAKRAAAESIQPV